MPEFNPNEDPTRLNGIGEDEPFEPPKLQLRFMPRTRGLAGERCRRARRTHAARQQAKLATRAGRTRRRACAPAGARRRLAPSGSRGRRRLSATCRGRVSGSQS